MTDPQEHELWVCPNCGDALNREWDEPGFPCEDCTKCQPMDGWYSSWPKISEDDPRYKDIALAPEVGKF